MNPQRDHSRGIGPLPAHAAFFPAGIDDDGHSAFDQATANGVNLLRPSLMVAYPLALGLEISDVLDTLAASVDTSSAAHQASSDTARKDNRDQWWAGEGRVSRRKSAISNKTILSLPNVTASQPTKWVSFEQVYREAGRTSHQARADVRGRTVLIKQLFPNNAEGWWPVHYKDGPPLPYRMSEEVARHWKKS